LIYGSFACKEREEIIVFSDLTLWNNQAKNCLVATVAAAKD
jgi:hypothetical protein